MRSREERVAQNEAIFREANEKLRGDWDRLDAGAELLMFLCECGNRACTQVIRLTRPEYEALRSNPRRFAIVPGHDAGSEDVVDDEGAAAKADGERYAIVEKTQDDAVRIVEEHDPRG